MCDLHFVGGQVEGDAALSLIPELEVAVPAHSRVQGADGDHPHTQDTVPPSEGLRGPHLVLYWQDLNTPRHKLQPLHNKHLQ